MSKIGWYIFVLFIRVVTVLPLKVLYLLSCPLYLLLYRLPGYRRKVVRDNLTRSFPEKDINWIRSVEKRFYRHLADLFVESAKSFNISEKEITKRFRVVNPELPDKFFTEGRDVIAVGGHYNNWEWSTALPSQLKHKPVIIYKPLSNKRFDKLMHEVRGRTGLILAPMSSVYRKILTLRNSNIRTLTLFIADQTPPRAEIKYRTAFLNQDTPVYLGVEKMAVKMDMSVLFMHVRKVKRGYYEIEFIELITNPKETKEHEVTEAHVRYLEKIIEDAPEYWVLTHRRWKHKREKHDG